MKVYYINADCGDGSSVTEFYDSREAIDACCDQDNGLEQYWDGDGGSWGFFEVPDGTLITGIEIRTFDDVMSEVVTDDDED